MLLLCRLEDKIEGLIVGWCPDAEGKPQAIIVTRSGEIRWEGIGGFKLLNIPKKLVRQELASPKGNF